MNVASINLAPHVASMNLLSGLCLWLVACDCRAGLPELFYDDFQAFCSEAPCDWLLEAGAVRSVATLHSSERGIRMVPGASISHTLDLAIDAEANPQGAPSVHVLAACDGPDTRLHFFLEVVSGDVSEVLEATHIAVPNEDDPLPLRQIDFLRPDGSAPGDGRAVRLLIEVDGPDDCTLDELRIVERMSASGC